MSLLASSPYLHFILRWGRGGLREHLRGDPPVTLLLCHMWVLSFKKLGGEVDGRIEGIVAGLSRLMMGIPKKEKGRGACLPHSARSRAVLAGRFLILGAQFFVDALCRGAKPQRGRRIVLKIDHIIIDP